MCGECGREFHKLIGTHPGAAQARGVVNLVKRQSPKIHVLEPTLSDSQLTDPAVVKSHPVDRGGG